MRVRTASLNVGLTWLLTAVAPVVAQDREGAARIAEEFFQGRILAAAQAASTCPGVDGRSDAVMAALTRPRIEAETAQLTTLWGAVPDCRVDELLRWSDQATRILTGRTNALALSRTILRLDSVRGARLLRAAATSPSVPADARGGYQTAVYRLLPIDDQASLYLETFHLGLQEGPYQSIGLRYAFEGPDPAGTAIRILTAVLADYENARAPDVLGRVMGVVSLGRFGSAERLRIWTELERHLDSLPPELRSDIEAYEDMLRSQ